MEDESPRAYKLPGRLRRMVLMSKKLQTTNSKELAEALERTEGGIHSDWNRLIEITESHSRTEVLLKVLSGNLPE